ncbi:unnamed protein product [Miscanthus lutarioriparius]|uniref:Uncharacterized protein n=1 Tax=Miscanthus lutarioriparius TaxID=422564 RepID=A0A811QGB7_9POAL|nr:unnamed protein product [Miscanthus lutarioriparius]
MAAPMAAADGGLRRLFEKPLPENPTLLEALSAWNRNVHHHHHPSNKPIVDTASITEIFGELHFQEKPQQPDHRGAAAVLLPPPSPPPPRSLLRARRRGWTSRRRPRIRARTTRRWTRC